MWVTGYRKCTSSEEIPKYLFHYSHNGRYFHRCEPRDSTSAAIQKVKKECIWVWMWLHVCGEGVLLNKRHVLIITWFNLWQRWPSNMIVCLKQFTFIQLMHSRIHKRFLLFVQYYTGEKIPFQVISKFTVTAMG